jgi:hypothetical protein
MIPVHALDRLHSSREWRSIDRFALWDEDDADHQVSERAQPARRGIPDAAGDKKMRPRSDAATDRGPLGGA